MSFTGFKLIFCAERLKKASFNGFKGDEVCGSPLISVYSDGYLPIFAVFC